MSMMAWKIHRAGMEQKSIDVILCDDDPAFLNAFRHELEGVFLKLGITAQVSAFAAADALTDTRLAACDLAFLDVDFEDDSRNGIDLARKLREVNRKSILFFVTNFIDYAPAGYEVQAFRYILKRDRNEVLERYILQAIEQIAAAQELLHLAADDVSTEVPLDEITYLEVLNHQVSIHTREKAYVLYATLSSLAAQLEKYGFLRIHNSYLVNMRHIQKYRSRVCLLKDGTELPASERNYAAQKQKYLLWKGSRSCS